MAGLEPNYGLTRPDTRTADSAGFQPRAKQIEDENEEEDEEDSNGSRAPD